MSTFIRRAVCGALAALAVCGGAASAQPQAEIKSAIAAAVGDASRLARLPPEWIEAVIEAESGGDPRAVSRAGAMGLMQLMPRTWGELQVRLGLGADPFDVRDNVHAGAVYMRELFDRFGAPGFLAAYNAGPQRYAAHLAGRASLPRETRAYLARLAPAVSDPSAASGTLAVRRPSAWPHAPLFPSAEPPSVARADLFPLSEAAETP